MGCGGTIRSSAWISVLVTPSAFALEVKAALDEWDLVYVEVSMPRERTWPNHLDIILFGLTDASKNWFSPLLIFKVFCMYRSIWWQMQRLLKSFNFITCVCNLKEFGKLLGFVVYVDGLAWVKKLLRSRGLHVFTKFCHEFKIWHGWRGVCANLN